MSFNKFEEVKAAFKALTETQEADYNKRKKEQFQEFYKKAIAGDWKLDKRRFKGRPRQDDPSRN